MSPKISWLLLSIVILLSCKKDKDKDTTPPTPAAPVISPFNKIVVLENVTVHLSHGSEQTFSISGSGDLAGVKRYVANEVLTVSDKGTNAQNVVVTIQHPAIEHIAVRNNGKVKFKNDFSTTSDMLTVTGYDAAEILNPYYMSISKLNIELHNAGKMALANLNALELNIKLTDGTRCNIEGAARIQNIEMDNGCRYNLDFPIAGWDVTEPALSDSCWISANNGAKGWVFPIHYLSASVNNGSLIYYKGVPVGIDENLWNGGQLAKKE